MQTHWHIRFCTPLVNQPHVLNANSLMSKVISKQQHQLPRRGRNLVDHESAYMFCKIKQRNPFLSEGALFSLIKRELIEGDNRIENLSNAFEKSKRIC